METSDIMCTWLDLYFVTLLAYIWCQNNSGSHKNTWLLKQEGASNVTRGKELQCGGGLRVFVKQKEIFEPA